MLFNGSPMEQAMPATGLGPLGPGNISPGSLGQGPGPTPQMVQGLPPHYNGSYHPSYMQQNIQVDKRFSTLLHVTGYLGEPLFQKLISEN